MRDQSSAGFPALVSREQAGNAVGKALRLFVGRGRQYSVKQLSNATGVKDRMIECAMHDPASVDFRPLPADALLSVALFLGPLFTNEWLCLARQGAFDLPDEEPRPGAMAADNADDAAALTRAAMDGQFDGGERKSLTIVGTNLISRGAELVALGLAA